jgi:hypothetical protein
VPEGRSVHITDVIGDGFETTGSGAIRVAVEWGNLMVTSRTYTLAGDGTYGQFIPGRLESAAITEGAVAVLLQLRQSNLFRSNFGFVNVGEEELSVRVDFHSDQGTLVANQEHTLPPLSWLQVNGAVPEGANHALVTSATSGARYLAYASVVDNVSGDPVFVPAQILEH